METLCTTLIKKILLSNNIENNDDEQIEVYVYGLLSIIYTFIPILCLLIIAIICNELIPMSIWVVCFVSLRKYAGGYHAPHPFLCFLCSIGFGVSSIFADELFLVIEPPFYVSIILIILIYFLIYSPITKKKLTKGTRYICKIKLCIIILFSLCLFAIFSKYQLIFLHAIISTFLLCVAEKTHK